MYTSIYLSEPETQDYLQAQRIQRMQIEDLLDLPRPLLYVIDDTFKRHYESLPIIPCVARIETAVRVRIFTS